MGQCQKPIDILISVPLSNFTGLPLYKKSVHDEQNPEL